MTQYEDWRLGGPDTVKDSEGPSNLRLRLEPKNCVSNRRLSDHLEDACLHVLLQDIEEMVEDVHVDSGDTEHIYAV